MTHVVDRNWIETEARDEHRTSWTIICAGEVVHAEEQGGDDPSGAKAFEAGLRWAAAHCPGVAFHWRHRSLAAAVGLRAPASRAHAPVAASDGVPEGCQDDDDAATRPARRSPAVPAGSCRRWR